MKQRNIGGMLRTRALLGMRLGLLGLAALGLESAGMDFSGRVTDGGQGVGGVRITYTYNRFGPQSGFVTTDNNGNWRSTGWVFPGTDVTFAASQSGYNFSPAHNVTVGAADQPGLNFTRTTSISGSVKLANGAWVSGITVRRGTASTVTDPKSGSYVFSGLPSGTYTITPEQEGFAFRPASLEVTTGPNRTAQNFVVDNPVAITLNAENIGFGEATFKGLVVGEGTTPARIWFEYGVDGVLDARTEEQVLPAGTEEVQVSATMGDLEGAKFYDFRCVAANDRATNRGPIVAFLMASPSAGSAFALDGNDYVNVADSSLQMTRHLTLEAWINPTGAGTGSSSSGGVVAGREGEYLLARFADGSIRYALNSPPSNWTYVNTGIIVPLNEWTHLAFTYDADAATNRVQLFVNGVSVYAAQNTGSIADAFPTQNDFRIGGRSGTSQLFQGQIDEVRVWNITRTPEEIEGALHRRLLGSETGLVAYFKMDGNVAESGPNELVASQIGGAFVPSGAGIHDPSVETLDASPVLATRATFQGSVNPSGAPTVAYFEYGETIAYGRTTEGQDIGGGMKEVAVSGAVSDLQPGTTYHFRSVAFNEFGTTYGEDRTFTTLVLGVGWPTTTKTTAGYAEQPKHVVDPEGNVYLAGRFTGSATFKTTMVSEDGTPDGFVAKLGRGADWLLDSHIAANGSIQINGIAFDNDRNIYVAGELSGTATFGTTEVTAAGETDGFLAKLNAQGSDWLWVRRVGAGGMDTARAVAVGADGSVSVAGHFSGTDVSFGTNILSSAGTQDIFVARFNSEGEWLWARQAGGTGAGDTARGLVLNSMGDAFVTGSFQGEADFGAMTLLSKGDTDLFVARISAQGQWLLARRAGGTGTDTGTGLAIDAAGQIYLLGQFGAVADYSETLMNLQEGLFVAKLNPNGNILWFSPAGSGTAESIVADSAGRVYITGDFTISTGFGSPPSFTLTSSGNSDVFVARLDADSGAWGWAEKIGSTGSETRGAVAVDAEGGVVLSGAFQGTLQVGYVLLTTANERDIFVARLDADAVFEHNNYVIGQPIPVPLEAQDPAREDGGAIGQPAITLLEREHPDSDSLNSFVWSVAERKLYPIRPVTAILKWPLTTDVTNTTSVATAVGRSIWPKDPQIHVANAPAELNPGLPNFPYNFLNLSFTTIPDASVEASSKVFHAGEPGWSVLQFLETGGELPNPALHPSKFEVVRTVLWSDPAHLRDNQAATIGQKLSHPSHNDPAGKNGFVFFERAFYDGSGDEKAYDRATRTGPIIPVNEDTAATDDDLVVIWYGANSVTGLAWPSLPVRYIAEWPSDPEKLVLASGAGRELDPADYPGKRVYNQPDPTLPGYNPNEEHAALYGHLLYALRNDLNDVVSPKASRPYTLLKYRDPLSDEWEMEVYQVVATDATHQFVYSGTASQQLQPPAPLSLLTLCGTENTWVSGPGFKDHQGRLYARAAGPNGETARIVARFSYPLQPGFFYDLNRDGSPDAPPGQCIPWLDRLPGQTAGVGRDLVYNISWPEEIPTLRIGETLLHEKFGLPGIREFARARVIYDDGDPSGADGRNSLVRMFDPLAPRVVQLRAPGANDFVTGPGYSVFRTGDANGVFAGIATANELGKLVFTDLPYTLRARLRYDPLNQNIIFTGLLDEDQSYGGPDNPLLLLNVLSPRERERIKQLKDDPEFRSLIDDLYDLSRNPNQLDVDGDGQPDTTLLVGLVQEEGGRVVPEVLGDGPKILTAGGARSSGYVTLVENNDPSLGALPVQLHILRVEGPFQGDIKVVRSDNMVDEKLTLRHSGDFAGEPQEFDFEWYYKPVEAGTDPAVFPSVLPTGEIDDLEGWTQYFSSPPGAGGLNDITLGDGGESSLLVLADNYFICRYRGYVINGETNWSDWVGIIGGGQAQLAEGWVKRVRDGLNPFESRTENFHENEAATFASMLQQAGPRYEGDIALNNANANEVGLIEAYVTVLRRAKRLSIEGNPPINYQPANDALLLAAGFIADLYFLLGNEAVADAADPTIGFRTDSAGYGTLAPSIFTFQNQVDSLLEEELTLLRGRDDSSASVRLPPVYNRLFWNFTRDEGEVAYAQAYNISDQNADGFIDATDGRMMFPQAHGDAWGHYLTATKTYYDLLRDPNFDWVPRSEPILLAGVPVEVDYLDERKFARAAAAKAKVGAEIVDLTYRLNYVDDPTGQFQGYKDTNPERAWGVSEWGRRAGSAAFFDWVLANAVLPDVDPDPTHTGITKIDRTTVPELKEIISSYEEVQAQVDKADAGLNPLGLAKNVVPFDIDPALISSGETHFEQIYNRALEAVNNTVTVFNHANQLSQALRAQQDSVSDFSNNVEQQERDYKNRLIEIFGYPYEGDIGAGKLYPSGYDGPDLYHYMYVNAVELNGEPAINATSELVEGHFVSLIPLPARKISDFFFEPDVPASSVTVTTNDLMVVEYPVSGTSYGFVAPSNWGRRRAPGEIQQVLSDMLQAQGRLKQALANYNALLQKITDQAELLNARYELQAETIDIRNRADESVSTLSRRITVLKASAAILTAAVDKIKATTDTTVEAIPKVVGTATDATAPVRGTVKAAGNVGTTILSVSAKALETAAGAFAAAKEETRRKEGIAIEYAQYEYQVQQQLKELEQLIREEPGLRLEAFTLRETLFQTIGNYRATLARGERLMQERLAFRQTVAADTQASRYQDMTFRIFRNDAIQKYRAQFDLAAQYVFLAAVAYDYETQLLGGRTGAGRAFLTDIVRQRALGEIINGVPVAGRHGLADPLARLNQNFGVLKGQLGFNNPQTETGRFSLRNELLRLRDDSDEAWRAELKNRIVANLWDIPEFRRYCRPFAPESAGPQPGLVIRFPTTVTFGLNYFGWPLGGGDNAYDPSLFATKVRSAGIWFEDYLGSGLSQTPRVYLVPAGADILRSPSGNDLEIREWRVVDQKIPVPFPIGFSSLNSSDWIPLNDSLSDTFAEIRRFSSFRAYHDSGFFDPAETITDSRLIGRSVWNTDWMLIIPGGTFLFDPNEGLDAFIESVSDIKIFFQTYAYSGN